MREILFRGKRTNNGEWVQGDLLQNVDCLKIREQEKDIKHIARSFVIVPETVGQYTGLTDKNGKKIFEGDILNGLLSLHPDRRIFQVGYEDNGFYFFDEDEVGWHPDHIVDYEVIGNIHDNPELLEVR